MDRTELRKLCEEQITVHAVLGWASKGWSQTRIAGRRGVKGEIQTVSESRGTTVVKFDSDVLLAWLDETPDADLSRVRSAW